MTAETILPNPAVALANRTWRLDPTRSSVEFHVRNFYGLLTVTGRFARYRGTLDLSSRPAVELVIEAGSLDTGHAKRDEHLRSPDFFDVADHPQISFAGHSAYAGRGVLRVRGVLHAAGKSVPLQVDATATPVGDELAIEATALADQRELGMTWSPLGLVRAPSRLVVRGRLVPAEHQG